MSGDAKAPGNDADSEPAQDAPEVSSLEPGAPIPADATDNELIKLSAPRARSPIIAGASLLLGALLLWRLAGDLTYALQPAQPVELGEVCAAQAAGKLVPGHHVALTGMPDYRNALSFEPRGERSRRYLFRLLGTASPVFVLSPDAESGEPPRNSFAGRLRRFDDLPYAKNVRDYYQSKSLVARSLDLSALRALPPGGLPQSVTDRAGQPLALSAKQDLYLDVLFPDDLRVLLSKDKFPSEPDARHEVERLGLPTGPGVETRDGYGYVLRLPQGKERNQILSDVDARGILLWHRVETYHVTVSGLKLDAAGVTVSGGREGDLPTQYAVSPDAPSRLMAARATEHAVPWSQVQSIYVKQPLEIDAGASLLLAGETPQSQRWLTGVAALLLLFICFNLWYLWLGTREKRT